MKATQSPIAVNQLCPWSGDPIQPDSLTTYRGHTVGFCNPGCRDKFVRALSYFDQAITATPEGTPEPTDDKHEV